MAFQAGMTGLESYKEKYSRNYFTVATQRYLVMDMQTLTAFFMWCTIINGTLLTFWTVIFMLAPNLVYRTQSKWFPIPRDTFNLVMYAFLGLYKIFFLVLNVVPYVALLIIA